MRSLLERAEEWRGLTPSGGDSRLLLQGAEGEPSKEDGRIRVWDQLMQGRQEARKQAEGLLLEWFPFHRWEDAVSRRDAFQSGLEPVVHRDAGWSRILGGGEARGRGCRC